MCILLPSYFVIINVKITRTVQKKAYINNHKQVIADVIPILKSFIHKCLNVWESKYLINI